MLSDLLQAYLEDKIDACECWPLAWGALNPGVGTIRNQFVTAN